MLVALTASASSVAETLWRTPWMVDAPQQILLTSYDPPPNLHGVAFADDGDLLIGSNGLYGYADEFVSRFGADGTLRWSGVVHAYDDPAEIVALPDGGAYATFSTSGIWGGYIARFDASGTVLWARDTPARLVVPIDADRVAVSDCESASMLDAATGVVLWHRTVGNNVGCDGGGLIVDGSTIYTIARHEPDYLHVSQRLVALDLDGRSRWEATLDDDEDPNLVGLGADGLLYMHKTGETIAVRTSDGSVAWRAPASGWILAGAAREPIVLSNDGIERLDAADGSVRWSTAVGRETMNVLGDAILVASSDGLSRIDAESGAILWTVALPAMDPAGIYYRWDTIGGLAADGTFSVVGRAGYSIFVQRADLATGALVGSASAPPITQGIYGYSARDGSDLVSFHFDNSNVVRMIDVDAHSGEIRWNAQTQIAEGLNVTGLAYWSAYAIGPTRVAAAVPLNDPQYVPSQYGLVDVVAYDRATGEETWNVELYDIGEAATAVETPIVDADGNVIASIAMTVPCGDGTDCPQQSILKLAAADGAVLWRVDNAEYGATDPKPILAIGDDVLVRAPFAGSTATIRRLAGSDGSIVWESDVFAANGVANLYRLDDSRLVAFDAAPDAYRWAALDAATGAVLWTSSAPCADPNLNCYGGGGVVASSGAIVVPIQPGPNATLAELENDGSGGFAAWPVADTRPDMITWLTDLVAESDGTIDYVLSRNGSWMGGGSWYRRFDPAAGSDVSSQNFPGLPLGAIEAGAIDLDTAPLDSQPSGSVLSREDVAIVAHGNLAASVTLESDVASPGQRLGFHLQATYAGDAALAGVRFRGTMRWASGATDLSCGGTGVSNCVLDATGRDVNATFDIAPGGTLDISGRILPLDFPGDASQAWIGARVLGPPGLDEAETADNFARANVVMALFTGGFDGN